MNIMFPVFHGYVSLLLVLKVEQEHFSKEHNKKQYKTENTVNRKSEKMKTKIRNFSSFNVT